MANSTTAISKYNTAVTRQSGRVGTVRYVRKKSGETYVRSASNDVINNPRTEAQMRQRMKFASLSALYAALVADGTQYLKGAFTSKANNQSDYNAFMQVNQGLGVYVSKQDRALGKVVALPVVIASGKLAEITCTENAGVTKTNLSLGSLTIDANTTVAQLSAAIISSNSGWGYGHQLTYCYVVQQGDGVGVYFTRVVLSQTDSTKVQDMGISTSDGMLALDFDEAGCIGAIHSYNGKVSKCAMIATSDQQAAIDAMLTDDVFATCSASYGTAEARYLSGKSTGTSSSASGSNGTTGGANTTKYTISLNASPANGGTVSGAGSYDAGSTANISATAASGYTFSKWSDGNTSASRTITVNENNSLTAIFTASSSGGGNNDSGDYVS